ncbi:putative cytochrome P450 hydroxylase [alpha proteobacterium U9-1i]|nr:putative cytochrome P450 hydroxylase [alpha proteobacterium U9-1i]
MSGEGPVFTLDAAKRRLSCDPHQRAFLQNPHALYARLHAEAPIVFWEEYGLWCVAGHDAVNRIFRDKRLGREPRDAPTGARTHLADFDAFERCSMLQLEPPAHTKLRTLVNRAFVSRQVERLRPSIEAYCNELIDTLPSGPFDLLPTYATPIPIRVIADLLGVPAEMGPQLVSWSNRMVAMYMHGRTEAVERDANDATRDFVAFMRLYVSERRRAPREDLLSALIVAHQEGQRLSEDELISSAILLLNAGHEATVHQTGNAVRLILAQHGDPRRFFATSDASAATVEECLRLAPPLHMFTRIAYERIELAPGVILEPGQETGLLLAAANTDPAAFANPLGFDPTRADQKNVSFGAGIHFCVGAPLARLELQIALQTLFMRVPTLQLVEESHFRDAYHFHGLERLLLSAHS